MQDFIQELMLFLTEEDISELSDKGGVRFPIVNVSYRDLCYISCWMGLKRRLPDSIHNRMVLGEHNRWVEIYINFSRTRNPPLEPRQTTIEDLFNLAG